MGLLGLQAFSFFHPLQPLGLQGLGLRCAARAVCLLEKPQFLATLAAGVKLFLGPALLSPGGLGL